MATMLRPADIHVFAWTKVREAAAARWSAPFAAKAAASLQHSGDVLAGLIDVALTGLVLLSDVVLAASLGFMLAGQLAG